MQTSQLPIHYLNSHMQKAPKGEPRWRHYFKPVAELSEGMPLPILGIMVLIWQLRDADLQQKFPLDTWASRLDFIAWCIVHGRTEYRALRDSAEFQSALEQQTGVTDATDPAEALTIAMLLIARMRPDLGFDLRSSHGRERLLFWYLVHGRRELRDDKFRLSARQITYLTGESDIAGLNRLQAMVYRARRDVQEAFPLPAALSNYQHWFQQNFLIEADMASLFEPPTPSQSTEQASSLSASPFGVNVVGYAYGQLGIGEDARMAAQSLLAADVPMTMLNFKPGANIPQNDFSMERWVGDSAKYSVNMFCMTALEQARYLAEHGFDILVNRFSIGYWPWELSQWPQEWQHLFATVDEVWASSQHTFDAANAVSPVPVRHMPMAVVPQAPSNRTRESFGLPNDATLFLFSFDLNSTAKRKNPDACIAAFVKGFPQRTAGAAKIGLVIKVHPPKGPNADWEGLKNLAAQDSRIHLIAETLSKEDLHALYAACDCFVSLHRAEGFGRNIAEVMYLARPVIVTGYSGNLDFTKESNALLIPYKLLPLSNGDYPYGTGQHWAEADVDKAAEAMKFVVAQPKALSRLTQRGQCTVEEFHSFKRIGTAYANMLADVRYGRWPVHY